MFIDETWTKTIMAPLRGWAPCGERLIAKLPDGHWNTMTSVAALRHDRIEAPWRLEGPINGERFRLYVAKVLGPTLSPGDVVIADTLGRHTGKAVRQAIRQAGVKLLLLPKYAPDLNRIEQVFAKLSGICSARRPRAAETLSVPQSHSASTYVHQTRAQTISQTQDTGMPKIIRV